MPGAPHTGVFRGKRVKVKMRNGYTFVARFLERDGHYIYFIDHPKVRRGKVVMFAIVKGNPTHP